VSEHTPGPWSLAAKKKGGERLVVVGDPWPESTQMACIAEAFQMSGPHGTGEGNARLIAAAPDLLAALRGLNMTEDRIVGAQGGDMIVRMPMDAITAAAAAIAKAEAPTP
jgi:hypothetical protein